MSQVLHSATASAFAASFPFWEYLESSEEELLLGNTTHILVPRGTNIYCANDDYDGIFLIIQGALRAYFLSEDGRDITLYRLFEDEVGAIAPNGALSEVSFDLNIETEKDCSFLFIPARVYQAVSEKNLHVQLYTSQLAISRYSAIMWTLQEILFTSFDKRLAGFLIDEATRTGSDTITLTHDKIARYIGSAREVVSRMLKYFSDEGLIETSRGQIRILNKQGLYKLMN